MRRVALLVVLLAAAAALAAAATAGQHARVAVTDRSPLTVRGTGFKPLEGAAAISAPSGISTALALPDGDEDEEFDDED